MTWTTLAPILGQVATRTTAPVVQLDWPVETLDWTIFGGLIALAIVSVVVYLQDARGMGVFWRAWLPLLRVVVVLGLLVIFLNPHTRSSEEAISPSRIVLLVDVSASMDLKNELPEAGEGTAEPNSRSRSEAVVELLRDSELVAELQKHHEVLVYTFGEKLGKRIATFPRLGTEGKGGESTDEDDNADEAEDLELVEVDWEDVLSPGGAETRLGDAVRDLVREYAGDTFAGVVVFSDGANNAGNDPDFAKSLARKQNVRLVTVGVGSTKKLANLRITGVQMPSRVQKDDPYTITAFVRGDNAVGRRVRVELLGRPKDAPNAPFEVVGVDPGSRNPVDVEILEDGREEEVKFERTSTTAGEYVYKIAVTPEIAMPELDETDNEHTQDLVVSEDPIRVLIIAGGPMREYHFVRDMMSRHKGIETSLWLQTIDPRNVSKVSQDANNPLLTAFPERAELFGEVDVIIGFDPDWALLTAEQRSLLEEWVGRESGGMLLVAGDVSTEELVTGDESFEKILNLYPVALEAAGLNVQLDLGENEAEAWAPDFTDAGRNVEFLQVGTDPSASTEAWDEFEGFYRCYPTIGKKAGAVVYAYFSNPKARSAAGPHILLAGHYYEGGRVLYLGSPEMWRMRAVDTDDYERFWTKAVREVAQGRLNRSGNGSTVAPERERYFLGQTVVVRSRVVDTNFEPVVADSIELDVVDPNGQPLLPRPRLRPEPNQPGVYVADFRASVASSKTGYKITMKIPGTEETREAEVKVTVPNLEFDQPERNELLLRDLAKSGGDREFYTDIADAAEKVPTFLVDRTKPIVVDERRNKLWDRSWVMYLLVALLSMEWLSRKLLKMA